MVYTLQRKIFESLPGNITKVAKAKEVSIIKNKKGFDFRLTSKGE